MEQQRTIERKKRKKYGQREYRMIDKEKKNIHIERQRDVNRKFEYGCLR